MQKTVYYEIVVVNEGINVTCIFLDPIKNRVSVKSVYVEAVYLDLDRICIFAF